MPHPILAREKTRITDFRREVYKKLPSNDGFMRRLLSRHGILRLEIFIQVLPIVTAVVVLRLFLEVYADFTGVIPSTAVTPFAGTCMFLIAVCIGGVLEDFKEAERLPGTLGSNLESISENIEYARALSIRKGHKKEGEHGGHHGGHGGHGGHGEASITLTPKDFYKMQGDLVTVCTSILEFLGGLRSPQMLMTLCTTTSAHLSETMESAGLGHLPKEIGDSFEELRDAVARMDVIKRTNFIPSGYALLTCLVHFTCILLTISSFAEPVEVSGGGAGRRRALWGAVGAGAPDGGGGDTTTTKGLSAQSLSTYFPLAIYVFLFQYTLMLINALEDPFDYSITQLIPHIEAGEEGSLEMSSSGGAEANIYPLFEALARLSARAHVSSSAYKAPSPGEPDFNTTHKLVELMSVTADRRVSATQLLHRADEVLAQHSEEAMDMYNKRLAYRHFLDDALHTALVAEVTPPTPASSPRPMGILVNRKGVGKSGSVNEALIP